MMHASLEHVPKDIVSFFSLVQGVFIQQGLFLLAKFVGFSHPLHLFYTVGARSVGLFLERLHMPVLTLRSGPGVQTALHNLP